MSAVPLKGESMRTMVVAMMVLLFAGCAPQRSCVVLLEQAEVKYRSSLKEVEREAPPENNRKKWKAALDNFGEAQSFADESQRKYVALKREDPDKNELLRKELEAVDYFRRFSTVYSCSLRMQGLALSNLGSDVYSEQKKKAGDIAAREAEERYKYKIDCGYSGI
jgi:hypothetical protein